MSSDFTELALNLILIWELQFLKSILKNKGLFVFFFS